MFIRRELAEERYMMFISVYILCIREVWISILENFSEQMGGPGKIVEIVESKFGKRKFH